MPSGNPRNAQYGSPVTKRSKTTVRKRKEKWKIT